MLNCNGPLQQEKTRIEKYGLKSPNCRQFFLLPMGNIASTLLKLPFSIALYQIKENDIRIIVLAHFFQEIWLKNSFLVAVFLLRMGNTASKAFNLPLSIALYQIKA